jgi:3-methyl-2-oxobutanoate hydroxymethyltransferase
MSRKTIPAFVSRKGKEKLVCVTSYDAPTAALLEAAGVDLQLVGDSVANVVLGYDSTIPVTMDEMVHHLGAVRRGAPGALVVADMPFGSYQPGPADAVRSAARFLKAGADAVKLEGGAEILGTVGALVAQGIPVMGHVGLMPQRVRASGGYRMQGRDAASAFTIFRAAAALDRAGAFAIVLESVPASLAARITRACAGPTIGIGAGPACDGQVLVFHDLVGLTPVPPPFAKAWAQGHAVFQRAVSEYAGEVRKGTFPVAGREHELDAAALADLDLRIGAHPEKP